MRLLLPLLVLAAAPVTAAEFRWADREKGILDLMYGDQPVLRYMYGYDAEAPEDTFKVYHHVFGPGTDRIITKGPGGLYTHHRGLFLGWNKVGFTDKDGQKKELDFWHGKAGAHQKHVKFLEKKAGSDSATMTSEIHWVDKQGEPVIVEKRTVTVTPVEVENSDVPAWQIDWSSVLESRRGEVTLAGDRQHAGFQFRADQPVAEANAATYIRPEGAPRQPEAVQVGDEGNPPKHSDLDWFAMSYPLDGERYTVEYFDNPHLPKPAFFSERPYGRFGTYFKTTLSPDEPLELAYRVIVSRGETPSRDAIQERYEDFRKNLMSE